MAEQSYAKHARVDPLYHRALGPLLLLIFIGALVNLYQSIGDHSRLYNASLIAAISLALIVASLYARIYPLKRRTARFEPRRISGTMC